MPFPEFPNPDWRQPLPAYNTNEGVITGRGSLTFSPWVTEPSNFPVNVGSVRAYMLFLSLIGGVDGVDVNSNYVPNKFYLGRYTMMLGNFVLKESFFSFRNQALDFRNIASFTLTQLSTVVSTYIFEVNQYLNGGAFDARQINITDGTGFFAAAPVFRLGYDLNPGVNYYYAWI